MKPVSIAAIRRLFQCAALSTLLLAGSLSASAGGVPVAEPGAATTATAATMSPENAAGVDPGTPHGTPSANWMIQVDQFFGDYLVTPLATVLMYDFGTGARWGRKSTLPFVVIWLLFGATFCTLRMAFINVRGFWLAVRITKGDFDQGHSAGEVSHFQALASALSATVGLGNIAGVAIAVATGGPGAVFWMIVGGLLGMTSKMAECTLGQMYRRVAPDGTVSGGPMHYLHDGLREMGLGWLGMVLSVLFSLLCIGGSLGGGCTFQVSQSLDAIRREVDLLDRQPWIYGLFMLAITALVILGGIRRIASIADKIVPVMCGLYVLTSLYILGVHASHIPDAIAQIARGVFQPEAAYGGFVGVMVIGIRRAAFSNEAGVGSASIAHSAAKTDRPVSEGIVALLEPFIDTVVVCTMTGLVIVITGAHRAVENQAFVQADNGAALTMNAVGGVAHLFRYLLCATVFLFAYSTVISWSYYGERCATYLLGPRASGPYKALFLAFVFLGSIVTATNIKEFSDLMILGMAVPNLVGVLLLSGKVRRALDEYWSDYRAGRLEIPSGR